MPIELRSFPLLLFLNVQAICNNTPASARALVQKFHNIVESFRDEGVDLDVFMLVEDENELRSVDESVTRKPDRTKER